MTYGQIYTKFLIEYDKADLTSSYPSLTEYEAATILDKAYLALIAQKVSGNNLRKSTIESDIKSVSDLQNLIVNDNISEENGSLWPEDTAFIPNAVMYTLPGDFLYFVGAQILVGYLSPDTQNNPIYVPVKLVPHESAQKFFQTPYNQPWIKIPVCYVENSKIIVLYDTKNTPQTSEENSMYITYIKKPDPFAKKNQNNTYELDSDKTFDCNDSMAEELISLAITFALENVESTRLNTKLNTRGLEA